jgi:hypothetical protein
MATQEFQVTDDFVRVNMPNQASDEEISSHLERLSWLAEGVNGPSTFNKEAAAYGYIEKKYRICAPIEFKELLSQDDVGKPSEHFRAIHAYTFMYWNYIRLVKGNVPRSDAFFIAAYRTRLVELGYLIADKKGRAVTVDEVDFTDKLIHFHKQEYAEDAEGNPANDYTQAFHDADEPENEVEAYIKHGKNAQFKAFLRYAFTEEQSSVLKHITFCAQQYAAQTYLVFRQLGHHYKPEYEQKYNILWRATTIEQHKSFPGNEAIHRLAVHSFGMKCFHRMFYRNLRADRLAETFADRSDVAPAGAAIVATCWASISLMQSLPIWNDMYNAYGAQIDKLRKQAETLKLADGEDAIKYHKNARLFGVQRYTLDIELAATLAPIAKGFIESLGDTADLARQKTLDKRANQNPLMVALVSRIITKVTRAVATSGDFSAIAASQAATVKEPAAIQEVPGEELGEEEEEEGE